MLRQPFPPGLCLRSVNHNDTCFGLIGGTGVVTKLRDVRLSGMKGPLPNAWLVDSLREIGGAGRNRTADKGFADLCLTTWRPRHRVKELSVFNDPWSGREENRPILPFRNCELFLPRSKKSPFYGLTFATRLMQNKNPPASLFLAVG